MRITLGPSVVRGNIDESITGLWTFANVLGLLTDIIGERTAAAGVTVDGLLIKDAGIPEAAVTAHEAALAILESQIADGTILARLAAAETVTGAWIFEGVVNLSLIDMIVTRASAVQGILQGKVTGDSVARFIALSDGKLEWGDGTGARDTNLYRSAANLLKSDDGFVVQGNLFLGSNLILSRRNMTLSGGATDDDVATGTETIQRLDPNATANVSGFAGGADGRVLMIYNRTVSSLTVLHDNAGSVAANRVIGPSNANFLIVRNSGVILWYDSTLSRWLLVGTAV